MFTYLQATVRYPRLASPNGGLGLDVAYADCAHISGKTGYQHEARQISAALLLHFRRNDRVLSTFGNSELHNLLGGDFD